MKLPNKSNAFIPREKLTEYLLSEIHPVGRSKAKIFRQIGFNLTNIDELEQTLLAIAQLNDVKKVETSIYGTKYVIDGLMKTPSGKARLMTTVWIVGTSGNYPSLVTAYPV